MKATILCIAAVLIGFAGFSQGLFSPLSKPAPPQTIGRAHALFLSADTLTPGTNYKGFRLQGAGALYAVALKPLSVSSSAIAVVYGIGWENDTWDAAKGRFYQKIGISLLGGPGGAVGTGIVGIVALVVSTQYVLKLELPFKLVLGIAYNTATNQAMAVTGPVNGLNN